MKKAAAGASTRRHPGADFGAQLVDQPQALLGLDVPEGPAAVDGWLPESARISIPGKVYIHLVIPCGQRR
jgi:hypothetical protein